MLVNELVSAVFAYCRYHQQYQDALASTGHSPKA